MEQPPLLSKNKLKKLKRDEEWEEKRDQRKVKRREKTKEKKARRRAALNTAAPAGPILSHPSDNATHSKDTWKPRERRHNNHSLQVPITIVLDCGFDELMSEKECKSLGAQITRAYSDNQKAPFKAHLVISSFEGRLKERFDKILSGHYSSWKGVRFLEDDFCKAGEQAKEWMKGVRGGKLSGALATQESPLSTDNPETGEIVYLTSDSPQTLTELKPYSTYIVGGIVDRNRHKGICYKRAMDRGVKTARLPIGDYMQMTTRSVLATNHVSEIMLRWLELGDWGEAFLRVIPKRKGGILKITGLEGEWKTGDEMEEQAGDDDEDDEDGEEEHDEKDEERENPKDDELKQQAEPVTNIETKKEQTNIESATLSNEIPEEDNNILKESTAGDWIFK